VSAAADVYTFEPAVAANSYHRADPCLHVLPIAAKLFHWHLVVALAGAAADPDEAADRRRRAHRDKTGRARPERAGGMRQINCVGGRDALESGSKA
jgi:hypothetical protein